MKNGITAIELLVAIGIIALVMTIALAVFSNFRENTQLISAHSSILGLLSDARSKTLASQDRMEHGVHFEATQAVLFRGTTYSASDPSNEVYSMPDLIRVGSINLVGGASDVYFARLTGLASATGTVVVEAVGDPANSKTITILSSGTVE